MNSLVGFFERSSCRQPFVGVHPVFFPLVMLLCALLLTGCEILFERKFHWFQTLTVTVDTPTGPKSGNMVIEIDAAFYRKGTHIGNAARYDISGEAGVIESAPAKHLFSLLPGFNVSTASLTFIPRSPQSEGASVADQKMYAAMESFEERAQTAELQRNLYPIFATFWDITDPASLVIVTPDNLAALFGEGVLLRSVVISVQPKAAFPNKIQGVLPWLEDVGRGDVSLGAVSKWVDNKLKQSGFAGLSWSKVKQNWNTVDIRVRAIPRGGSPMRHGMVFV